MSRPGALSRRVRPGMAVRPGGSGLDVIEESLNFQVVIWLDPLTPDRLVLPDRAALDRVAQNRRARRELCLEPVLKCGHRFQQDGHQAAIPAFVIEPGKMLSCGSSALTRKLQQSILVDALAELG